MSTPGAVQITDPVAPIKTSLSLIISNKPGQEQFVDFGKNDSPANLANWSGTNPITIEAALDRIISALRPIPLATYRK